MTGWISPSQKFSGPGRTNYRDSALRSGKGKTRDGPRRRGYRTRGGDWREADQSQALECRHAPELRQVFLKKRGGTQCHLRAVEYSTGGSDGSAIVDCRTEKRSSRFDRARRGLYQGLTKVPRKNRQIRQPGLDGRTVRGQEGRWIFTPQRQSGRRHNVHVCHTTVQD